MFALIGTILGLAAQAIHEFAPETFYGEEAVLPTWTLTVIWLVSQASLVVFFAVLLAKQNQPRSKHRGTGR